MAKADRDGATQPQKSYHTILVQEITAGLAELKRPRLGLFLSSLSAGLDIGFSLLLMATMLTLLTGHVSEAVRAIVVANMYSVGFILVILGRSELFTEHTALAVLPVLDRRSSLSELAGLWGIVFGGNIIGAAVFAVLVWWIAPQLHIVEPWTLEHIAEPLVRPPWWLIFLSAVLAGWLMGELAWLLAASRDTISQIVCVWIITTVIGVAHLHHCVVGTVEVLAGVLAGESIGMADFAHFLLWTTLGNALGGVVFVAMIKYGHASRSSDEEKENAQNEPPAGDNSSVDG